MCMRSSLLDCEFLGRKRLCLGRLPYAKSQLIGKDPDAGKDWGQEEKGEGDNRGWDGWMASLNSMDMSLSKVWEMVKDREAWHAAVHGVAKSWIWLSDWTTTRDCVLQNFASSISGWHMTKSFIKCLLLDGINEILDLLRGRSLIRLLIKRRHYQAPLWAFLWAVFSLGRVCGWNGTEI